MESKQSLSAEQRHRMEENKKRALEKRAAKQGNPSLCFQHGATLSKPNVDSGNQASNRGSVNLSGGSVDQNRGSANNLGEQVHKIAASTQRITNMCQGSLNRNKLSTVSKDIKGTLAAVQELKRTLQGTETRQNTSTVSPSNQQSHFMSQNQRTPKKTGHDSQPANFQSSQPYNHSQNSQKEATSGWLSKKLPEKSPLKMTAETVAQTLSPPKMCQRTITGHCKIISREKFQVIVSYHSALIDVFKKMPTSHYDYAKKIWFFHLKDYKNLIESTKCLRPDVVLHPLPSHVLQVFSKSLKGENTKEAIPDADLTRVDNVLVDSLMHFQRIGVNFAISRNARVLIADDMGLGKTIQAICVACYYRQEWPLLVIVPSSVRFAWKEQFKKWVPSLDPFNICVVVTGKDPINGLVNILSYDLMATRKNELMQIGFKIMILDESHLIKNSKTSRAQAASPLMKVAKRVIMLTGTPALSRPNELFSQVSGINPRIFPSFHDFGLRYCNAHKRPWGWDYSGASNLDELQIILEESIMIRRLKSEVLDELPEKRREMILLDPKLVVKDKKLKAFKKLMSNDRLKGMERRGTLLEYFNATASSKIGAVKAFVLDLLESAKKFLLFAHHSVVLDSLEEVIKEKKYKFIRIDGSTRSEDRQILCKMFQTNDDIQVALLSITAANSGINMNSAALVVFAELFWNPGILVQAEDRVHRIGQKNAVNIQYLVGNDTADDILWPMVQNKLNVLGRVGLSKEDFTDASMSRIVEQEDPSQLKIMQIFEEEFKDELDYKPIEDDQNDNLNGATAANQKAAVKPTGSRDITSFFSVNKKEQKPSSVSSAKAEVKSKTEPEVSTENYDWLDDDDWEENVLNGPDPKKMKLNDFEDDFEF